MHSMHPNGSMSTQELCQYLIDLNRMHSDMFISPTAQFAREEYRRRYPTEIAAWKCMDGRCHLTVATGTPLGIIQPSRNLGGKFDLGWPYFGKDVTGWVNYAHSQNRQCIILVTYHFSASSKHRGCAGFGYDTQAAINEAYERRDQIRRVYKSHQCIVYPIVLGFETDHDACIFHGSDGEIWNLGNWDDTEIDPIETLSMLYPDLPITMINDLLPLVLGNLKHISHIRDSNREIIDFEHRERVLAVGRGFDWLHIPNLALIVGQYNPDLGKPIATAASIIQASMDAGRISSDGCVLLCSALYREPNGIESDLAREKAKFLQRFAITTVSEAYPALAARMLPMAVIVDMNTRLMEVVG